MAKRTWVVAVLIGAAAVAAALWWQSREAGGGATYRTARIERGSLQAAVSASGTVTPVTQVQVSSQVSGQIKELFVDFNSEVRQGQLIARLDPESFEYRVRQSSADVEAARASVLTAQANVLQASAQVSRAQVDLQEAERDLQRKLELVARNFISPAEADRVRALARTLAETLKAAQAQVAVANAQAQSAQAIVRQREAQLAQARVDLERTQIRSPVDGIIIKRSVEVGQTVAASLQAPELFIIAANLSDMQVETSIDEADIARVRNGQKVSFTIDAFPGRSFDGAVRQVRKAAVTAQNVTTYTVVVAFATAGGNLLPGMTANVRIITDTRDNVLKVPNAALRVRIAGVEPATSPPAATPASGAAPVRSGAAPGWSWLPAAHAQPAGVPPGGGGLRDRLVGELGLDGAQQGRLDAILAELRPRFQALRELSDDERPAAREKVLADLRERLNAILGAEQRQRYAQLQAARAGGPQGAGAGAPSAVPAASGNALTSPVPAAAGAESTARTAPAGPRPAAAMADTRTAGATQAAAPVAAPGATVGSTPASVAAALPPSPAAAASGPAKSPAPGGAPPAAAVVPPTGGPAAGPLREFRDRLVAELGLDAAQTGRIDAVMAATRPRFAELRTLPEEQRGKARERILADMRAQIAEQLTPSQRPRYQELLAEIGSRQSSRGRVYLLGADGKPVAYNVRLGISDGVATELIVPPGSPGADVLVEGATVITAVVNTGAAGRPGAPAGPRMPF